MGMIGLGMLGRAELFFVVVDICYMEHGIFSTEMFYSLTIAATMLNITVPIAISMYRPVFVGEKQFCGLGPTPDEPLTLEPGTGGGGDPRLWSSAQLSNASMIHRQMSS